MILLDEKLDTRLPNGYFSGFQPFYRNFTISHTKKFQEFI